MGVAKTTIVLAEGIDIFRKSHVRGLQVDCLAVTAVSSGSKAIHAFDGGACDGVSTLLQDQRALLRSVRLLSAH